MSDDNRMSDGNEEVIKLVPPVGDSKDEATEEEKAVDKEEQTVDKEEQAVDKEEKAVDKVKEDHEELPDEPAKQGEIKGAEPGVRARRAGTTVAPNAIQPHRRKISFADQKVNDEPRHETELTDIDETTVPLTTPEEKVGGEHPEEVKDKYSFLKVREKRFSTTSRFSIGSRPSFSGLVSRPSMVSIKSTLTKVNSELYPERGSFVATNFCQSFAEMPKIAEKLYIITQVLAAISVSMGSMAVGYTAGYTGIALPSIKEQNSTMILSKEEESWVVSLMPVGAMTGSIAGGYLVDALGRKMLIMLCGPPFLAGWIIIGSAYNVWMLYVGRALCGICVGFLTLTLPVYLGETIQPEIRGTLGLLPTTFGNFGILLCFTVGTYADWSWLAYSGAIIPLIFFAMMIFVPETPRWYVSKGQTENAERSLQWLRGSDNDVEFELEAIEANFSKSAAESSSIREILKRRYLKPFGLSIGLMVFQQLSGINAVISYTVNIFLMAGSSIDGHLSTIIVGVVNLLSTFVANALVDKLGRKILLYVSAVAMIISLFSLGIYFFLKENDYDDIVAAISWLPLISFMVYVVAFSLGWGPIPWLFMGEALPAKIRGPAASVVTTFNWICNFIITKTFPDLLKLMGPDGVFFLYGAIMVLGLIFATILVPETKGKTLEEIEAELSGDPDRPRQRRISEMSGIYIK